MGPLHKRFDEADDSAINPSSIHEKDPTPDLRSSDSEPSDDDDDAPEAISTSAAANATLSTQKKIAHTISHAASEAKTRRKAREQKLAAQTKSRPPKSTRATDLSDDLDSEDDSDDGDESAPTLLPLSVLAAAEKAAKQAEEAEFRASVPENLRKRKFLDVGEKKVRDVRVGRTTMRVLEKAPGGLAPKASGQSRGTREAWLRGRRGRGKAAELGGRKVVGRGFAVK